MEWNALTMLRLYNATKDEKYLTTVKELWADIIAGSGSPRHQGGPDYHGNDPAPPRTYADTACAAPVPAAPWGQADTPEAPLRPLQPVAPALREIPGRSLCNKNQSGRRMHGSRSNNKTLPAH